MYADSPGVPPPYVPPPPPGFPSSPAPPVPAAPPATESRDRLRQILGALVAIGLVAAAALVGATVYDDMGARTPTSWDPRVAPLAEFVEQHRKLQFVHPVNVYFLSDKDYERVSGGTTGTPSAADRERSRKNAAEYRALGVLEGDPDLLDAKRTMQESGTLAYYTPVDKVINVRGTTMTPSRRVTLVHELTHALQDQHFEIGKLTSIKEPDAAGAARAVIEGDAVATEQAYVDTLSPADKKSYDAEIESDQKQATDDLGGVPNVLQTVFGSYYAVGNAFVEFWDATANGEPNPRNLDEVLKRPPPTSAQLYDPRDYLDRSEPPKVTPARLPRGAQAFQSGRLGAGFLFVMLSERIDPIEALTATDGLQDDAYRSGTVRDEDGVERMCVSAAQTLATNDDARQLASALTEWAATMPAGADVEVDEPESGAVQVGFRACDAGPKAKIGVTGRSATALVVPVVRLRVAADAMGQGFDRAAALCFGTSVVGQLDVADLTASERSPKVDAAVEVARQECS